MRNTGSALGSILQQRDTQGVSAHERVLRATFWIPSQTRGCAEVIALEAVRARREQSRK